MLFRHLSHHGSGATGDALDMWAHEGKVLEELAERWRARDPGALPPDSRVEAQWDRGTVGKLLLEHGALWLAALRDVLRVLGDDPGEAGAELAALRSRAREMRPLLDAVDERSRGVQPLSLVKDAGYLEAVGRMIHTLGAALADRQADADRLAELLDERRGRLHSAKQLAKRAPTHPGSPHWYHRIPGVVRLHAAYDRLRGFPWAESQPLANQDLARHYDS